MDKERAGTQPVEAGFAQLEGLTHSRWPPMQKVLAAPVGMGAAKTHRDLVCFQRLGLVALKRGLVSPSRLNAVRLALAGAL